MIAHRSGADLDLNDLNKNAGAQPLRPSYAPFSFVTLVRQILFARLYYSPGAFASTESACTVSASSADSSVLMVR